MSLKINKEKSAPEWLVLESDQDELPRYEIICKWDGCVHFTKFQGEDDEDADYIHSCSSLDDEIGMMQEAKKLAVEFFKHDPHNQEYWK